MDKTAAELFEMSVAHVGINASGFFAYMEQEIGGFAIHLVQGRP